MTRVLVCGGRFWNNQARVDAVLDTLHGHHNFTVLIRGGQKTPHRYDRTQFFGADYQAKVWAEKRGVPMIEEAANWAASPRGAGMIRNGVMLSKHKPDLGVAFKGGTGTANMVDRMRKARLPVTEFDHT